MMPKQLKTLIKLELCNLYGWNVFRFTRDKKEKRKKQALMLTWAVVILLMLFYVGGLSYGLIFLGMGRIVPAYLIFICSIVIFFFGIFKAGSTIFRKNGYDMLCSLPVSQASIVISRLTRMYVENFLVTVLVMFPGMVMYGWMMHPAFSFYLLECLSVMVIPLLPITGAVLVGAVITGISSRMKHKSLVISGLSVVLVLVIMFGSSKLAALEDTISLAMLELLAQMVMDLLGRLYPPAVWLGTAIVEGNWKQFLLCTLLFVIVFFAVAGMVSWSFQWISRNLYSTSAKHNYQMKKLEQNSVLRALVKKELKGYFSSSIYVSNTILGPILGTVFAGTLLFVNMEQILGEFPMEIDPCGVVPLLLASIFCLMTTTCTSVSMEGKNWWIAKSLPLSTKVILDAKILINLILILPCYFVAEIFLMIALKPSMGEVIWILVAPASIILFSLVYGITINLHFPVMNWENEVTVVKQSASALIGGMGGFLVALICMVLVLVMPDNYGVVLRFVICVVFMGMTYILYRRNNRVDLREI